MVGIAGPLAAARAALARAEISEAHVRLLAAETAHLPPGTAADVARARRGLVGFTVPGYAIALAVSAFLLCTFGGTTIPACCSPSSPRSSSRCRRVSTRPLPD